MRGLCAATIIWVAGCVSIDGGAVELRWAIRDNAGVSLRCGEAGIETVTLVAEDEDGQLSAFPFDCEEEHGTTNFELHQGRYLFRVDPAGPGAVGVAVPNPIVAGVRDGEVTDLQVLVLRTP